jgi:PAS domain S-box-containing protein
MKQESKKSAGEVEEAVSIVNSDGIFVDVNEALCSLLRYSPDRLIGTDVSDYIASDKMGAGRRFEKALKGEWNSSVNSVRLGNGDVVQMRTEYEDFEEGGEIFLRTTNELVNSSEDSGGYELEDIEPERLNEITGNLRVETPSGTMTVEEVMLDLTVGENEVTKYKKGALSLHQAIDERLEEEEQRNPNSEEVAVLREASEAAFSLYKRIQNGDRISSLL